MQYRFEGSRIRDLFADRLYRSGSKAEGTDEILREIPWKVLALFTDLVPLSVRNFNFPSRRFIYRD